MSARKPVEGWEPGRSGGVSLRAPWFMAHVWPAGQWHLGIRGTGNEDFQHNGKSTDMESAQLAAEDALFAIADAINALRGKVER